MREKDVSEEGKDCRNLWEGIKRGKEEIQGSNSELRKGKERRKEKATIYDPQLHYNQPVIFSII